MRVSESEREKERKKEREGKGGGGGGMRGCALCEEPLSRRSCHLPSQSLLATLHSVCVCVCARARVRVCVCARACVCVYITYIHRYIDT